MTNEEIISKLIELGQNMYHAYSYLKDDASRVKSAMEDWHKFVTLGMQEGRVLPGMEQIDNGVAWRDYVPVDAVEDSERYGQYVIKSAKESSINEIVPTKFCEKYIKEANLTDYLLNGQRIGQRSA